MTQQIGKQAAGKNQKSGGGNFRFSSACTLLCTVECYRSYYCSLMKVKPENKIMHAVGGGKMRAWMKYHQRHNAPITTSPIPIGEKYKQSNTARKHYFKPTTGIYAVLWYVGILAMMSHGKNTTVIIYYNITQVWNRICIPFLYPIYLQPL